MYATDNDGYWPYQFIDDRAVPRIKGVEDEQTVYGSDWYDVLGNLWHLPCLDAYNFQWDKSLACPADRESRDRVEQLARSLGTDDIAQVAGTILYEISMAMYYDPAALDPGHPSRDPKYFVGTRMSDVLFPAGKAAMFESAPFHEPWFVSLNSMKVPPFHLNVAAVDCSVVYRDTADCVPAVLLPGTYREGWEEQYREINKLKYTPSGVRGQDW